MYSHFIERVCIKTRLNFIYSWCSWCAPACTNEASSASFSRNGSLLLFAVLLLVENVWASFWLSDDGHPYSPKTIHSPIIVTHWYLYKRPWLSLSLPIASLSTFPFFVFSSVAFVLFKMYKLALLRVAAALASFVAVSALPVFDTDLAANPFVHEARRLQYYKQPRM